MYGQVPGLRVQQQQMFGPGQPRPGQMRPMQGGAAGQRLAIPGPRPGSPRPGMQMQRAAPQQPMQRARPPQMKQQMSQEQLEAEFVAEASAFWDSLMDLNVPSQHVGATWLSLFQQRNQLLESYGQPAGAFQRPKQQQQHFGGAQFGGAAAQAAPAETNWKQSFRELYVKKLGRSLLKEELTFTHEDAEGGYVARLFLQTEGIGGSTFDGEPCNSKKLAEHSAAKAAMEALFPQAVHNPQLLKRQEGPGFPAMQPDAKRHCKAKKGGVPDEPKSRFVWAVTLVLGLGPTKEQVTYEVQPVADTGCYQATLHMPDLAEFLGEDQVFTGEQAETKKAAEQNAAAVAFAAMEERGLQPFIDAHEAKKKEKNTAQLERLKEMREEKKLARGEGEAGQGDAQIS